MLINLIIAKYSIILTSIVKLSLLMISKSKDRFMLKNLQTLKFRNCYLAREYTYIEMQV